MSRLIDDILFDPVIYLDREKPHGLLPDFVLHPGAHALFHWLSTASHVMDNRMNIPRLEGERLPPVNFRQLLKSVARRFGVEVEVMVRYHDIVFQEYERGGANVLPQLRAYLTAPTIVTTAKDLN